MRSKKGHGHRKEKQANKNATRATNAARRPVAKKSWKKATTHTKRIQINIAIFIYATVKLEIEGMGQAVG
jgi:hypothetical protein